MTKAKTTSQKHAELKRLSAKIRDHIYKMVALAHQILSDHEYVDELGGEPKVIDMLQEDEFAHFGGSPTVSELVAAYRKNPDEAVWRDHKYNVWAMIELTRGPEEPPTAREHFSWKARAKELEEKVAALEAELQESKILVGELTLQLNHLRDEMQAVKVG